MEQVIKIDPASGITAEEAIRLNTIKHQITTTTENFLTDIGAYRRIFSRNTKPESSGSLLRNVVIVTIQWTDSSTGTI